MTHTIRTLGAPTVKVSREHKSLVKRFSNIFMNDTKLAYIASVLVLPIIMLLAVGLVATAVMLPMLFIFG